MCVSMYPNSNTSLKTMIETKNQRDFDTFWQYMDFGRKAQNAGKALFQEG